MEAGKPTTVPAPEQDTFSRRNAGGDRQALRGLDQPATLREQIREARERAGLSLRKLARILGIHRNTVQHFENGGDIDVDDLCRIIRQLRIRRITLEGVTYVREDATAGNDPEALTRMAAELRDHATALFDRLRAEAAAAAVPNVEADEESEAAAPIAPV
ncbi:MAG TPA: helix-turn-helix domain-containing protein [Thermoanaerobaculia bacterium]|nr:helix-turn-helix domain-containing protein [Thermoanaerobaculia bacterium]